MAGIAAIIIIFTRGTSEAKNVGTIVGPPAFKTLRKDIGDEKKVVVQGVEWDALLSTYQFGGDPKGIADMYVFPLPDFPPMLFSI